MKILDSKYNEFVDLLHELERASEDLILSYDDGHSQYERKMAHEKRNFIMYRITNSLLNLDEDDFIMGDSYELYNR